MEVSWKWGSFFWELRSRETLEFQCSEVKKRIDCGREESALSSSPNWGSYLHPFPEATVLEVTNDLHVSRFTVLSVTVVSSLSSSLTILMILTSTDKTPFSWDILPGPHTPLVLLSHCGSFFIFQTLMLGLGLPFSICTHCFVDLIQPHGLPNTI